MLEIYKLDVYGFQGGSLYELGEKGVNCISSLPNSNGYCIYYDNMETIYITGFFQFVATERAKKTNESDNG